MAVANDSRDLNPASEGADCYLVFAIVQDYSMSREREGPVVLATSSFSEIALDFVATGHHERTAVVLRCDVLSIDHSGRIKSLIDVGFQSLQRGLTPACQRALA